jgi:hypothetical protein
MKKYNRCIKAKRLNTLLKLIGTLKIERIELLIAENS